MNLDTTPFDISVAQPNTFPAAGIYPQSQAYPPVYQQAYPQAYPPTSGQPTSIIYNFFSCIFGMSRTAYIVIAVMILMVIFSSTARDIADTMIRGVLFAVVTVGVIYIANKF